MSYNIALLDRHSEWATVFIGPDVAAETTGKRTTTNLQHGVEWPAHARATRASERLDCLEQSAARASTVNDITRALLQPPLFQTSYKHAYGTLYTAVYLPRNDRVELHWPTQCWSQSLASFSDGERCIVYSID
jgi:predicted choloylglycine hydrolase